MNNKSKRVLSTTEVILLIFTVIFLYTYEVYNIVQVENVLFNAIMILVTTGLLIRVFLNCTIKHDKK